MVLECEFDYVLLHGWFVSDDVFVVGLLLISKLLLADCMSCCYCVDAALLLAAFECLLILDAHYCSYVGGIGLWCWNDVLLHGWFVSANVFAVGLLLISKLLLADWMSCCYCADAALLLAAF